MSSQLLTQSNNHVFICGATQSGKTHFAGRALAELRRPVLFINIQDEDLPLQFITINCNDVTTKQLIDALKDGAKISLTFPTELSMDAINSVCGHIMVALMGDHFTKEKPMYLALDECQILKKSGLDAAIQIATRGLKRGLRGVFITQRPALCDKTLYTQCVEQYIFRLTPQDGEYFKTKGVDFDSCMKQWETLGSYSYCYYNGFELQGRKAV